MFQRKVLRNGILKIEKKMDSRSTILARVKKNKPSDKTIIDLRQFFTCKAENTVNSFCHNLEANDGSYLIIDESDNLQDILLKEIKERLFLDLSGYITSQSGSKVNEQNPPKDIANIKVFVVNVDLGVAENGAIWLEDNLLHNMRVLPFIVEHTIFILNKNQIVPTMHEAYESLGKIKTGFGTFIAGPSKTGDIEQNLVIGAHGPLSHLVILY